MKPGALWSPPLPQGGDPKTGQAAEENTHQDPEDQVLAVKTEADTKSRTKNETNQNVTPR